jgi:hypothetical protein
MHKDVSSSHATKDPSLATGNILGRLGGRWGRCTSGAKLPYETVLLHVNDGCTHSSDPRSPIIPKHDLNLAQRIAAVVCTALDAELEDFLRNYLRIFIVWVQRVGNMLVR